MAKTYTLNTNAPTSGLWYVYDIDTGTTTSYLKFSNATGDFLDDTISVGDILYMTKISFSTFNYSNFDRVYVSVSTPMAYDAITFAWEYYDMDGNWSALSNVTDGTNGFTQTGWITFDVPSDWQSGGIGSNCYVSIRARVTAVTNGTEGGAGYIHAANFYLDCEGGTSGDPITFDDVYDYCVTTLGRTDMISKHSDRVGRGAYTVRVNLRTFDYFNGNYASVEWIGSGFQFDDNTSMDYAQHHMRYAPANLFFYTDSTFNYCTFLVSDQQRTVAFGGTGTYNRCVINLGNALVDMYSTYTFTDCYFPDIGWWRPHSYNIDFHDTVFSSQAYIYGSGGGAVNSTLRNFTLSSGTLMLDSVDTTFVNGVYPITTYSSGTGTYNYKYECDFTILDTDGNAIQGATISISDLGGSRVETHAKLTATAGSGQKVVTVDDTSLLSAGDSIEIGLDTSLQETKTIDTVDSGTQITLTENLTNTHREAFLIHNNTTQGLTTDSNGQIDTQELMGYQLIASATKTWTSPHTLTISKSGYITQTHKITMDEKKDLVFTLEEQVPVIIAKGEAAENSAPEDITNMIYV